MKEELSPENATAALLERVPAFAEARAKDDSFISHDDDGPYVCFGDLDRYLLELLGRESKTPGEAETTRQIFELLNVGQNTLLFMLNQAGISCEDNAQ
jgi:hypothetical protein